VKACEANTKNMRRVGFSIGILPGLLLFACATVGAQSQGPGPVGGSGIAQAGGGSASSASSPAATQSDRNSPADSGGLSFPTGFPGFLKNRLVSQFSIGYTWDKGVSNSNHTGINDRDGEVGASFTYSLERRRSSYVLDYGASARIYSGSSSLNVVTHSAGISQNVLLGPRTTWGFRHGLNFTPDFSRKTLSQSISDQNILSGGGPTAVDDISPPSTLPTTIPELSAVPSNVVNFRSYRMTNISAVSLLHHFSERTSVSFNGNFERTRYQDPNLFGSNALTWGQSYSRTLSPQTAIGLSYGGAWFRQVGSLNDALTHSVSASIRRQFFRGRLALSIGGGPSLIERRGSEVLRLPAIFQQLFGIVGVKQDISNTHISYTTSALLASQLRRASFQLSYGRSVSIGNALSLPSESNSAGLSVSTPLFFRFVMSSSVEASRGRLLGVSNIGALEQGIVSAGVSRPLPGGVSFDAFFAYSRVFHGVEEPGLLTHKQFGGRLSYTFPRADGG